MHFPYSIWRGVVLGEHEVLTFNGSSLLPLLCPFPFRIRRGNLTLNAAAARLFDDDPSAVADFEQLMDFACQRPQDLTFKYKVIESPTPPEFWRNDVFTTWPGKILAVCCR